MDKTEYQHRAIVAKTLINNSDNPDFWVGYWRGLQRLFYGTKFGTFEEHKLWLSLQNDIDNMRKSRGLGYQTGFKGINIPDAMKLADGSKFPLSESILPVCSPNQKEKRERLILKLKAKNTAAGCKVPEGNGSKTCPNVFAVATKVMKCRLGSSKLTESGDTIRISGKCEDGKPEKCTFGLRRVGKTLQVIGTSGISKAVSSPALKEEPVPANVQEAIKHPITIEA